jgi:hypothetical protein
MKETGKPYQAPSLRIIELAQCRNVLSDASSTGEPFDDQEIYDGF